MMQNTRPSYTLYVDGACRGNPGPGGWGALIIDDQQQNEQELFGGELDTTNNRMELSAAIEGIQACPIDAKLTIYTDSSYVQKGITEWIVGWKKKNWKNVKNPDLWQKLDLVCANRNISWNWIKGHTGHEGNERADQLANLGTDSILKKKSTTASNDWLLDDPFGFDEEASDSFDEIVESTQILSEENTHQTSSDTEIIQKYIKITEATNPQHGERQLILDTETTGFYYQDSDRIIEVGAIEMINRRLTGSSIHIYINPEKTVGESENIHGLSDAFLSDKPVFQKIAQTLFDYLKGAEIVAHNATFDMNFLNAEFERVGLGKLSRVCSVTDTLLLAKKKHPGQKNSLDALVKRYEIPARDRTFHGALLDAEILADVYLVMTGGQVSLDIDQSYEQKNDENSNNLKTNDVIQTPLILPQQHELDTHVQWMQNYQDKNDKPCLFAQEGKH